jgi:hypothetical protein
VTEEDRQEMINLETILIALDDKIHRIQAILHREMKRLKELKEKYE